MKLKLLYSFWSRRQLGLLVYVIKGWKLNMIVIRVTLDVSLIGRFLFLLVYIFFSGFVFWFFFSFFLLIYGGFGIGAFLGIEGLELGFFGLRSPIDEVWALWCGAFRFFWDLGFLHKHWRIILGKNFAFLFLHMNSNHAVKLVSETHEILFYRAAFLSLRKF